MQKPQIPVAVEGYPFIAFSAFTTLVFSVLGYEAISVFGVFITAFITAFFRDPERISPNEEDVVVAPADGKIIAIERLFDDRFTKEHVYRISIFMNIFNVHVNRMPFPGTISGVNYHPGNFLAANTDRAVLENEYCALIVTTGSQRRFSVVQIAGLVARRVVCWAAKGDQLARGQRFGLIRFGSRVDLYLPLQVQLEVSLGQKVKAGETILGYLS